MCFYFVEAGMRVLVAALSALVLLQTPDFASVRRKKPAAAKTGERSRTVEQQPLDPNAVNGATWNSATPPEAQQAAVVRAQILLDRANFSVGEIDGNYGKNT